jgi:hypothetical protein
MCAKRAAAGLASVMHAARRAERKSVSAYMGRLSCGTFSGWPRRPRKPLGMYAANAAIAMTTIYEIPLQHWVGSTDVNGMLGEIGGWHVGSIIAVEKACAVQYAVDHGWVQQRTHYGPALPPEGVPAYELTDSGLVRLEKSWGPKVRKRAEESRQWYRDRVAERALLGSK